MSGPAMSAGTGLSQPHAAEISQPCTAISTAPVVTMVPADTGRPSTSIGISLAVNAE